MSAEFFGLLSADDDTDATEINPYALRSKALGIYVTTQGVALSFNQYVNPIALKAIGEYCPSGCRVPSADMRKAWKYYFVFSGIQIFLIVFAYFFFVETKGYTIEEVSLLYDGHDAADKAAAHGIEAVPQSNIKGDLEEEFVERAK